MFFISPPIFLHAHTSFTKTALSHEKTRARWGGYFRSRHRTLMTIANDNGMDNSVSSRPKWKCMPHCGACCKLNDFDLDVLRDMLRNENDVVEYLSMINPEGWCKHFDSFSRKCSVYDHRPRFCRATPEVFEQLYDVCPSQFDDFAISCCEFHIENTYGEGSHEAYRYDEFKDRTTAI